MPLPSASSRAFRPSTRLPSSASAFSRSPRPSFRPAICLPASACRTLVASLVSCVNRAASPVVRRMSATASATPAILPAASTIFATLSVKPDLDWSSAESSASHSDSDVSSRPRRASILSSVAANPGGGPSASGGTPGRSAASSPPSERPIRRPRSPSSAGCGPLPSLLPEAIAHAPFPPVA